MIQQPLKGIHDKVASFAGLLIFLLVVFLPSVSKAQQQQQMGVKYNDVFTIMSPLPDSTIMSGELFISVKFINSVELANNGLRIMIDDRLVTTFVKISNHNLTILYPLPLKAGAHNIEITAKEKGYQFFAPIAWRFYVRENKTLVTDSTSQITNTDSVKPKPKMGVSLLGSIVLDNRHTQLSGPGAASRQEPPRTTNANINLELKVGKVSFPLRVFNTSDEQVKFYQPRGVQSRNYFQTGISHEKIELLWGDMSPSFDKLVLTGLKMRGYKFALNFKRFQMQAIRGQLARAVEGTAPDSTQNVGGIPKYGWVSTAPGIYIQPGIFERNVNGLRLVLGNKMEGTYLGLNFLKVKDNPNSIKYGVAPKDNFVVGADQTFATNQNKMKGSVGWAYSFLTADASKPAATKAQIDSALGSDLKVDPYKFRNVFITNFTTVKPAKNAMSMYANVAFRSKVNIITFDFRYFGAGYQSLGNPYLKVDIRQFSVQDQVYMFKRKMNLSVRYQYQDNNRSKTQYSTVNQHLLMATYLFAPSVKWPQLMINYMLQNRRSPDLERQSKTLISNDFVQTLTSSLIYTLRTGKSSHSINLQYTQNDRIDKIYSFNNNNMKVYSGGIREQIAPLNLGVDLQFTQNISADPVTKVAMPFSQSADTRLRYQWKKIKTMFGVGYIYAHMLPNAYTMGNTRQTMNFNIICNTVKNFTFELEGGKSPYRDPNNPLGFYNEAYVYGRITHALGFKFR